MTNARPPRGGQGHALQFAVTTTASGRTRLTELLILCSRIGFNP